jgi:hypothetical protein
LLLTYQLRNVSNTVVNRLVSVSLGTGAESVEISPITGAGGAPTVGTSTVKALQPHVGMSPANAETAKTQVKTIVASIRFIDVTPV